MASEDGRGMSGVQMGLLAALLFGLSTPVSKLLLLSFSPLQLAGLLYLGAALGVLPTALREDFPRNALPRDPRNRLRLFGAVLLGGLFAPVLLLTALRSAPAGAVALLLNLEIAATALLGLLFFREHLHLSGFLGVVGIVFAGALLAFGEGWPSARVGLIVGAACLCWGLDNHFTALIDGLTPAGTVFWKGSIAGMVNLLLGLAIAPLQASWTSVAAALCLGAISYGASIALYIHSSQQLGATRAQGLFASAPFAGAAFSFILLREPFGIHYASALGIFGISVFAVLRSRHTHGHRHEMTEHTHSHRHDDDHHSHKHEDLQPSVQHTHPHDHEELEHIGRHWPDLHHRHGH